MKPVIAGVKRSRDDVNEAKQPKKKKKLNHILQGIVVQRFPYYGNGSYNCTAQGDLDCNKHNNILRRRRRSVHIDGIKER